MSSIWPTIAFGLVGVIGLLYGLLERRGRQAADSKADTFSEAYKAEKEEHKKTILRYEGLVSGLKDSLERLRRDLNARVPSEDLVNRINDALRWRVSQKDPGSNGEPGL